MSVFGFLPTIGLTLVSVTLVCVSCANLLINIHIGRFTPIIDETLFDAYSPNKPTITPDINERIHMNAITNGERPWRRRNQRTKTLLEAESPPAAATFAEEFFTGILNTRSTSTPSITEIGSI